MTPWTHRIRKLVAALSADKLGYEAGANTVAEPDGKIPDPLLRGIYEACGGVSLPDVRNGYFIEGCARVETSKERGEPSELEGAGGAILVFGSDGGGGRFAVGLDTGEILYLPSAGAVCDNVYHEDTVSKVRVIARSAEAFLDMLEADVRAFVNGDTAHTFIA